MLRTGGLFLAILLVLPGAAADANPPSEVQAAYDEATGIVALTWTGTGDSYRVYRNGELLGTTTTTAFQDPSPLTASTYTITSWNDEVESAPSPPVAVLILPTTPLDESIAFGPRAYYGVVVLNQRMCEAVGLSGTPPYPGINWDCLPGPFQG